ncbi:MAG: O-acetyl-ADP-ribose deacetylase [Acidobacteria bacterium]|nr:O-acetyl-ADP-ribose deacetylase [Acidobacteriota bacterium]MBI3655319.1 O-acetyl-ADP-ribose deacetylase [Acidobacteriota bacterium]
MVTINQTTLTLVEGDIASQAVDAVVNAANAALAGGGGVDGAIHRAGGPAIMKACRAIGGCSTGSAVITTGGRLLARYVIHAVGPIWRGGQYGEAVLFQSAYRESLRVAVAHNLRSIAFPSLSTGAYGYPIHLAAALALRVVLEHMSGPTSLEKILFVLFDQSAFQAFQHALAPLVP